MAAQTLTLQERLRPSLRQESVKWMNTCKEPLGEIVLTATKERLASRDPFELSDNEYVRLCVSHVY